MADNTTGQPNLNLTPEEKNFYGQLFRAADPDGFGAVSGDVAVKFFEKTRLHSDVLGQIWQTADAENRGFLTPNGFSVVLRLVGHAQSGRTPSSELATQPGPLPRFEGFAVPPLSAQNTGTPASPIQPAPGAIRVPPLSPDKVNEYAALFEKSGVEGGMLAGVTAKQIFERARLPNEVLGRIWSLADTKERGELDTTEFVIAMHLLASVKSGAMRGVPQSLPTGLWEAASRRSIPRTSTGSRPSSAIPPQASGLAPNRTHSPIARPQFGAPLSAQSTGDGWLVSPADKATFDSIFASIDRANRGFITGEQAVDFFSNSRLPEEVLASIWDLSDVDSDGQLNKDEFAVAMFLIRQQRGRQDGRSSLPPTLPPALIPPSMRRGQIPPSQTTAPTFDNAANISKPRSAAEDLFGLDTLSTSSPQATQPTQTQERQTTGGTSTEQVQRTASPRMIPHNVATSFKPFVPSSSFGQSIVPQSTGMSSSSASQLRTIPQASDDLLGDADPEVSQKLTQETSELANLSNQVGTLSKQMQEVQGGRVSTERELSQSSQQKKDFEARLSQLRSMYEKEVKDVKSLEERLAASRAETKKLQQEIAMLDGTYQDLRSQHAQTAASFETDQRENAGLKENIRLVNTEIANLKPQLEKLRSDARQQKGLVAINKKQLSTNEGERDRIQIALQAATREAHDREKATSGSPNAPRNLASPAISTTSQNNNPFFRRTTTSTSDVGNLSSAVPIQQPLNDSQAAFDSVFGPPATVPSEASTPTTLKGGNATQPESISSSGSLTGKHTSESPFPSQINEAPAANKLGASSQPLTARPGFGSSVGLEDQPDAVNATDNLDRLPEQEHSQLPAANSTGLGESSPKEDSVDRQFGPPSTLHDLPGTFPGLETPAIETPVAAPNDDLSTSTAKQRTFDDFFGGPAQSRPSADQATDFDQAFANLNGKDSGPNGKHAESSAEFPPIQELDGDDSSESSDNPVGFDDNFSSAFPDSAAEDKSHVQSPLETSTTPAHPNQTEPSSAKPPQIEAQASPPPYDQSLPPNNENRFPPEFDGLLPSRQDPTSPSEPPHSIEHTSESPGAITSQPSPSGAAKSPAPPSTDHAKVAQRGSLGDDFDTVFANLREGDDVEDQGDVNDSFASVDHTGAFDPSFDPAFTSRSNTSTHEAPNPNNSAISSNNFHDFESSSPTSKPSVPPASQLMQHSSHDWDAIFAGLDAPAPSSVTKLSADQSHATSPPSRPLPGRALSTGTEHDDPILKRLTGMGWRREESLQALEKFDYNLDKAVDFLASKS